jgi:hypothetical protein
MTRNETIPFAEARRALAFEKFETPCMALPDRDALHHHMVEVIGAAERVVFLEFDVGNGRTLRDMARAFPHPDSSFVAFGDLVAPWVHDDGRVKIIAGSFRNMPPHQIGLLLRGPPCRVLAHYDALSYAAALFVLTNVWPHCQSCHVLMDECSADGIVALHDFSLSYPMRIEFRARCDDDGACAALVELTRVEVAPPVSAEAPDDRLARAGELAGAGRIDDALELWSELRQSHPERIDAWLAASMWLRAEGRIGESETLLADAAFAADEAVTIDWARLPLIARDWEESVRRHAFAAARFPDLASAWTGQIRSLREAGRWDAA